jgi:hypothetical protein
MSKVKISLSNIFYLNLKSPIMIEKKETKKKGNDKFIVYNKELNILGRGATFEGCLKDFQEQLYILYKEYTTRNDNELSNYARSMKNKFYKYIKIES